MQRSTRAFLAGIAVFTSSQGLAVPVNYDITFTQTWLAHDPTTPGYEWLGPRLISGQLSIDDSVLGPSHANAVYGPSSPELSAIYSYTVTLDSKVYFFDQSYTAAIGAPPIASVIRTDSVGAIADLQGAFRLPGSISSIILGRVGRDGTYTDVQQVDPFNAPLVSSGTYTSSLVSSVPEPGSYALVLAGLGMLGLVSRRRKGALSFAPKRWTTSPRA
ncbi:PEP-CTERM sorting domain-containing protein [Candidatus Accumulibacter sp. ACC007]|uniref:PEP-CTERM sorting domain-containing protein n=1 Tax=Candidatus Accumulibacter sp. ACC007 TaxID=2823333 RepID=UPI0025BAF0AA|nr:PEP-CTERM sorting domain-containing protein [Candidatus Accumulibacter sp. ACC007]